MGGSSRGCKGLRNRKRFCKGIDYLLVFVKEVEDGLRFGFAVGRGEKQILRFAPDDKAAESGLWSQRVLKRLP
jgi:hypothetical protein